MHGFLVAGRGIEQADESLGLIPPRVQGQPKQNLTDILRVDIHSHRQYRRRGSAKTHHRHTRTHTEQAVSEGFAFTNPSQDIHTDILRANIHSHPHCKRKGSAKGYHKRHTHTHTRKVVGEGFAFTRPCQNIHKHTGNNKPEPMSFIGQCNKSQETPTGVVHTNRPWFRRILALQGGGKEGTRIERGRHRHGAQNVDDTVIELGEDRHKGWFNAGLIPNEMPKVERYEDFLPLHDWLLRQLGGRQRYILYRINMISSPQPRTDLVRNNWMVTN
jgi:hypothetical protein